MKQIKYILLTLITFWQVKTYCQTNQEKGFQIMVKVEKSITGYGHYSVDMGMTLINKGGKSFNRKITTYSLEQKNDGEHTLSVFKEPADVKEMKILLHSHLKDEDDQWLYIPSLKSTKRIANENKSGSFMGSEIAYEDMGTRLLYKFDFEFLREDKMNGKDCFIVRCFPKSKHSGYSYKDVYVEKNHYVPFYLEYFDRKKELLKIENIEFKNFEKHSWLPVSMDMKNIKQMRTTKVTWTNYKFDNNLNDSFFLPANMETAL